MAYAERQNLATLSEPEACNAAKDLLRRIALAQMITGHEASR